MNQNLLKVVSIGSSILGLTALGFLGYKVYSYYSKEDRRATPDTPSEKSKVAEHTPKGPENKNKYSLEPGTFETPDELVEIIAKIIIEEGDFKNPGEFLSKLIRECGINIEDDEWYGSLPRNVEELNDKLVALNLFEQYNIVLYKKYMN